MSRIGPYGDGSCSRSYDGTLVLDGTIQTVSVECYVGPKPPKGVPTKAHGGSANLAMRDGKLAVLGNGHLNLLDCETLAEVARHPTMVTCGFQGWDRTNFAEKRVIAGHSVPCGLATIYWLENGLISVRCGGDIGSTTRGFEFVRVAGDAPIPQLQRESNQREWLAICDGNPLSLVTMGGHAFGRTEIEAFCGADVTTIKVPNLINAPSHLSTPDAHYLLSPGNILYQKTAKGADKPTFTEHATGLSVWRVNRDGTAKNTFTDSTMGVWTGWDGSYAPQPWCLQNGRIYAVTKTTELSVINVSTWGATRYAMPSVGFKPRLAVNRAEIPILCGLGQLCRPAAWTVPVPLDGDMGNTNKQYTNHQVVDDANVFLCRLIGNSLLIDVRSLKDGKLANRYTVPIPFADATGQCHDFFAADGALYALVTPGELPVNSPREFTQTVVRVS